MSKLDELTSEMLALHLGIPEFKQQIKDLIKELIGPDYPILSPADKWYNKHKKLMREKVDKL